MSPWYYVIPIGGQINTGPEESSAEMCKRIKMKSFFEMSQRLRGHAEKFNGSESIETRKEEIKGIYFWRGINFPDLGMVPHINSDPFSYKPNRPKLKRRFFVSDSEIIVEVLKDSSESEYEEVKRFPLNMLTLEVTLTEDKWDFIITALWRTGSEENASFDSSQL